MTDESQQEPTMEEILASIRRIISEDEAEEGAEDAPKANGEGEDEDILELTEEMITDVEEQAEVEDAASPEDEAAAVVDDVATEEAAEFEAEPAPQPEAAHGEHALISDRPAGVATTSFHTLSETVSSVRDLPLYGSDANTLESLVKELLKPMLKDWLDANLPHIVERLVEREISKLSRRAD